jgi:hypothetical protein
MCGKQQSSIHREASEGILAALSGQICERAAEVMDVEYEYGGLGLEDWG